MLNLRERSRHTIGALSDWHPWVLAIVLAAVVSGMRGVLTPPDPRITVNQYIPEPWRSVYYLALLLGGLVMLASATFRSIRDQLMVEQIGLWVVSGVLLIYQAAIVIRYGEPIGVSSMFTTLIALGGLARIGRILWELRILDKMSHNR